MSKHSSAIDIIRQENFGDIFCDNILSASTLGVEVKWLIATLYIKNGLVSREGDHMITSQESFQSCNTPNF